MAVKRTIVIVEDEPDHQSYLLKLVKDRVRPFVDGHRLTVQPEAFKGQAEVLDALDGTSRLRERTFCVLLDIGLESSTAGLNLIERVGIRGEIPIVVVTQYRERTNLEPSGWAPLFVLDKPVPFDTLVPQHVPFDSQIVQAIEAAFVVSSLLQENRRLKAQKSRPKSAPQESVIMRAGSVLREIIERVHAWHTWIKLLILFVGLAITVTVGVIVKLSKR